MIHLASLTNLAGPDLIIILLIVLVLFGAKRLPDLAKGMGQAFREFHKAKKEFGQELHSASGAGTTPAGAATSADRPLVRPAPHSAPAQTKIDRPELA